MFGSHSTSSLPILIFIRTQRNIMEFKPRLCFSLLLSFTLISLAQIVPHPDTQIITNSNNLDLCSLCF